MTLVYIVKRRRYKKEGKSIKYLDIEVFIKIGFPIIIILILLNDKLTVLDTLFISILGLAVVIAQSFAITQSRKTFRKIFGLPPEDEDTGEVIKEDNKKQ